MRDILAEIVEKKREIVAAAKRELPLTEMRPQLQTDHFRMARRVRKGEWSLIAECKLRSPAKGDLCRRFSVDQLAEFYEANGAAMLSVHTDPHFLGKNEDLQRIAQRTALPVLRKDFIIDAYQIYEARYLGAAAVLLIVRILSSQQLAEYLALTAELGMDALVEVHDRDDMERAMSVPSRFLGINNRNLTSFTTSIGNTLDLLPYADASRVLISESGVHTQLEARRLQQAGCDGILVGEGLAVADDIAGQTAAFARPEK